MKINNWPKISVIILVGVFLFTLAQVNAASESDAIAVRVLPNTNHDSIETWYANQGYTGSPQSLIVDGYEAIRDGRTVFVNAANLDPTGKKLYTNIYLISYNQESETKTVDILGQLISHWKFNNNINTTGSCSISKMACQQDADCPLDHYCSGTKKCLANNNKSCLIDSDCGINLFCDSLKAKAIRDTKRLGVANQINKAIFDYKTVKGSYPALQSGTYILGSSLSVWPSWRETLWPEIGLKQLLVDPINSLGNCPGYEASTCWDAKNNTFVNSDMSLPNGSYVFVYSANKGFNYSLCSVFETKYLGYDTLDGRILSNSCYSGETVNSAPKLVGSYTNGLAAKEFNGYLMAKDDEGDEIYWNLEPVSNFDTWSKAPVLTNSVDNKQKNLFAAKAGLNGSYEMILKLSDSRGASRDTKLIMEISAGKAVIEANDATYTVGAGNYTYSFVVKGLENLQNYILETNDPKHLSLFDIDNDNISTISDGFKVTVPLSFSKIDLNSDSIAVPFTIKINNLGVLATKNVVINLKVEKPNLSLQCETNARLGKPYYVSGGSCLIGPLSIGANILNYQVVSSVIKGQVKDGNYYLFSDPINLTTATTTPVKVVVTNQYGFSAEDTFNLKINNFCGDGIKQSPNTEGRGGVNNDGQEDCDGLDGVTSEVSTSPDKQYACSTGLNVESPFPILDTKHCVFASPETGGGYCGDGYCQRLVNGQIRETGCNCPQDCSSLSCCGDGVVSGNEVCDPGVESLPCSGVFSELPEYCSSIDVMGTKSCKDDCSAWNECVLGEPDMVASTATACANTDAYLNGYSCCEIVNCFHDLCDCCGRYEEDNSGEWMDLLARANLLGYEGRRAFNPDNFTCSKYKLVDGVEKVVSCVCGEPGCTTKPYCPRTNDSQSKNNSCVVAQGKTNLKNWAIITNHTTVDYRCWR